MQDSGDIAADSDHTAQTIIAAIGSLSNVIQTWPEESGAVSLMGLEWMTFEELVMRQRNRLENLLQDMRTNAFKRLKASTRKAKAIVKDVDIASEGAFRSVMKGKSQTMSTIHLAMVKDICLLSGVSEDAASRQGLSSLRVEVGAMMCHPDSANVFNESVVLAAYLLYLIVVFSALTVFRGNETWKVNSDAGREKRKALRTCCTSSIQWT
jgi:hypothetical protein